MKNYITKLDSLMRKPYGLTVVALACLAVGTWLGHNLCEMGAKPKPARYDPKADERPFSQINKAAEMLPNAIKGNIYAVLAAHEMGRDWELADILEAWCRQKLEQAKTNQIYEP